MRRILLFVVAIGFSGLTQAQNFNFYYPFGTTIDEGGLASGEFSTTLKFLKNQAGDPVTFKWEVFSIDTNKLGQGVSVDFGVCDNASCYSNVSGNQFEMTPISGVSNYGMFKIQAFQVTGDVKLVVRVRVWDKNNPALVDTIDMSWRTDNWVSLGEFKKSTEIGVFPNPASDKLKVSYDLPVQGASFEIVSVLGNRVYQKNLTERKGELDLNVSRLAKGVYFYTVKEPGGKVLATRKLVIE